MKLRWIGLALGILAAIALLIFVILPAGENDQPPAPAPAPEVPAVAPVPPAPEPVLTPIDAVAITGIAVPLDGDVPANADSFTVADDVCRIRSAHWTTVPDGEGVSVFSGGTSYCLEIRCDCPEGCTFSGTAATFNGCEATPLPEPGAWSYIYTCGAFDGHDCGNRADVCPGTRFLDLPAYDNWAHAGIDYCVNQKLMSGVAPGRFDPDADITRAQLVTILYRVGGSPAISFSGRFTDVPADRWYADAVEWAAEAGIVTGNADGAFRPDDAVTREQIAAILYRYADSPDAAGSLDGFPDRDQVSGYAAAALAWATDKGLINGLRSDGETRLAPRDSASRGQIAAIIMRCLEDWQQTYRHDESEKYTKLTQSFDLYFGEEKQAIPVACMGNRPYVAKDVLHALPIPQPDESEAALQWGEMEHDDRLYLSLSDAAALYGLGVEFRPGDSSVHLYRMDAPDWDTSAHDNAYRTGYLRLEDIMADRGLNGRFTHENLVKLRLLADYLGSCTDRFYIAWIPLYVNPGADVRNDISTDFSFYNTDFVFTLDTLVRNGGRLGLHGLTHQSGDSISADGFEFGTSVSYTTEALLDRFRSAEAICHTLGYDYDFFEFSHYDATEAQMRTAECFFDTVCQAWDLSGQIRRHYTIGHDCIWVPTPAGHVQSAYDRDGIAARLEASYNSGSEISIFFHPVLDCSYITVEKHGSTMTCTYDEAQAFLPAIMREIGAWGYAFGPFPE